VGGVDSAPDIVGPRRGKWNSAMLIISSFHIPQDDFIRGVEYYYEGVVIYGIRLELYFNGWTHWIGGKNTMSTLTLHLDVMSVPLPEDEESIHNFKDEPDSAFKKRYIIGFTYVHIYYYYYSVICICIHVYSRGIETFLQATGIGLVVRTVTNQHIFSYHWIDEAICREADRLEIKKRQEKLKMEREQRINRKLKTKGSSKISLPQLINQHIISKLSKNSKYV
jgi:hypothetical protein